MSFDQCAEAYATAHEAGWRSAKNTKLWRSTMATYCSPIFGQLPVSAIDTALVMKMLQPLWMSKTPTAMRLRERVEAVLDWAKVSRYRDGENPARWRGHLDHLLPPPSRVRSVAHHAALPYAGVGAFMAELDKQGSTTSRALAFLILTAARSAEVRMMTWAEIDMGAKLWTIPASRMKSHREHRVPLSAQAMAVLKQQRALYGDDTDGLVFLGARSGRPVSDITLSNVLEQLGRGEATVHGFRSSFRDWAGEATAFPRETVEAALAHVVGDATERAYRRGDALEKRRRLMDAWARYCAVPVPTASVVPLLRG